MNLPRRSQEEMSFQLAPMIDMTFLLLIFFMVTTRISKEQVKMDIKLPVAANATVPSDLSNRDIISIDGDGKYYAGSRQVSREELGRYLKQRLKDHPPLRIYVRADRHTQARQIKELMRMAAEAGAVEVIFGSYNKP
jgi:biopolymer transport protein ExbD